MTCRYHNTTTGETCNRTARRGYDRCARHHSSGRSNAQNRMARRRRAGRAAR